MRAALDYEHKNSSTSREPLTKTPPIIKNINCWHRAVKRFCWVTLCVTYHRQVTKEVQRIVFVFFKKANRHLSSLEGLGGGAWCWRALIGGTQVQKQHVVILIGMYSWNLGCCLPRSTEANKTDKISAEVCRFLQLYFYIRWHSPVVFMRTTASFLEPWKAPLQLGVSVMWQLSCLHDFYCKTKTSKTIKLQNQWSLHIQVTSADARARPDLLGDPQQRPPEAAATRLSLEGNPGQAGHLTDR